MPTRLGNTLRALEDKMRLADGGDLEGFILRNYERLPGRLIAQVSDFRTRLNMYCTLVLAWIVLALVAIPSTWHFAGLWHITTVAGRSLLLDSCEGFLRSRDFKCARLRRSPPGSRRACRLDHCERRSHVRGIVGWRGHGAGCVTPCRFVSQLGTPHS